MADQSVHVLDDTTIIGRHEDCNLVLTSERGASRKHARITIENDEVVLMDLGSLNGTMVNGREISRPVQLVDGDIVIFDQQKYQFIGPSSMQEASNNNVTVIANKEERANPEKIKPAIRVVDTESLDETEAWEQPADISESNTPKPHSDLEDHQPIAATSRPGGDAPKSRRQRRQMRGASPVKRYLLYLGVILLCLAALAAFYFAYQAGINKQ